MAGNSTPLSAWDRLTSMATLGLARQNQAGATGLDALWPDPALVASGEPDVQIFLRAAAANYLWQVAGTRAAIHPPANASTPVPATTATVSEPAAWRLARMINGEYPDLVREWFALAATSSRTLPMQWLPMVLDRVDAGIRGQFTSVLGQGATWLAAINERWCGSLPSDDPAEERWLEGTLAERCAQLTSIRSRDPALARDWLQRTWAADAPEAREAFLKILLPDVSLQDELLLETALDDKRKGVRQVAVECLSKLPESSHAKRILGRLEPLFVMEDAKGGLLGSFRKRKLSVTLPDSIDKATVRDGVDLKPPAQRKIGERTFWLIQMLAMTPPAHWSRRFDCSAEALLQAAAATEFSKELLEALSGAAIRHPDLEWVVALCNAWTDSGAETHILSTTLSQLVASLQTAEREPLIQSLLQRLASHDFTLPLQLMSSDIAWTSEVTRLALKNLRKQVNAETQTGSYPRTLLIPWAQRCDIDSAAPVVDELLANCPDKSPWRNALGEMNAMIEFRKAMKKELA